MRTDKFWICREHRSSATGSALGPPLTMMEPDFCALQGYAFRGFTGSLLLQPVRLLAACADLSGRKGPDEKANHPCPYRNGLIWCAIPVAGCGFFAFPAPNIDGSCLFGWTLDFLRSYRTLLYGFCLGYH